MTNIPSEQINQARTLLTNAKSVLIVTRANPTLDGIASSLALYLALSASGREVTIACPSPMTVEFSRLVGVDKIGNNVNNGNSRNLVISFPYQEGSIEKVSYNIENDTFNLVIESREGYPIVTPEAVRYSYSGGKTDLIIAVDTPSLSDLNSLYNNNQALIREKPVINIDSHSQNQRFGKINLVDPNVSSISELVVFLLSLLGLTIDGDIASNLLSGMTFGSQNFTSSTTSVTTFEAAAICLHNGARKENQTLQSSPQIMQQTQPIPFLQKNKSSFPPSQGTNLPPSQPQMKGKSQLQKPAVPPFYQQPPPKESTHPETPPDWLKPKIYKGSTLL